MQNSVSSRSHLNWEICLGVPCRQKFVALLGAVVKANLRGEEESIKEGADGKQKAQSEAEKTSERGAETEQKTDDAVDEE